MNDKLENYLLLNLKEQGIVNVILEHYYFLEHMEKYQKCLDKINKLNYKIYDITLENGRVFYDFISEKRVNGSEINCYYVKQESVFVAEKFTKHFYKTLNFWGEKTNITIMAETYMNTINLLHRDLGGSYIQHNLDYVNELYLNNFS